MKMLLHYRINRTLLLKTAALILAVVITALSFASCAEKKDELPTAFEYEGYKIDSGLYAYILSSKKTDFLYLLSEYQISQSGYSTVLDNEQFWATVPDSEDERDYAARVTADITDYCKRIVVTLALCDKYGIKCDDETYVSEIDQAMLDNENEFGGEAQLNKFLLKYGMLAEDLESYFYMEYKIYALQEHLYGSEGKQKIASTEVAKLFEETYVKVKNVYLPYSDSNDETVKAETLANAQALIAELEAGTKDMDTEYKETEDSLYEYYPDGWLFKVGETYEAFEKAAFEAEVGDYFTVTSAAGVYVVKKEKLTSSDLENYYSTVEETLIADAYYEYVSQYYSSVYVNNGEISKYDIVTAETFN